MLDIRLERHDIFVDKVEDVQRRIAHLAQWPESPSLVTYTTAELSPLLLTVHAHAALDGSLWQAPRPPLRESAARSVLRGAMRGVYALHARGLVHGHLRPECVLVGPSAAVRLARHVLPIGLFSPSGVAGERVWGGCAPEIHNKSVFGFSADVWGVGALLLRLVAPAGREYSTEDLLEVDVMSLGASGLSPAAVSFALQCLLEAPEERPSVAELLIHPFLAQHGDVSSSADEEGNENGNDEEEDDEELQNEAEEGEEEEASDDEERGSASQ